MLVTQNKEAVCRFQYSIIQFGYCLGICCQLINFSVEQKVCLKCRHQVVVRPESLQNVLACGQFTYKANDRDLEMMIFVNFILPSSSLCLAFDCINISSHGLCCLERLTVFLIHHKVFNTPG